MTRIRPTFASLLLAVTLLLASAGARAADFYVNVSTGVDDLMLANGSVGQPWKTLTFAIAQIPDDLENHVIHLAAGVYSEAEGEVLPYRLVDNVSLEGAAGGGTVLLDTRAISGPTIFWQVRSPRSLDATNRLRRLEVRRETLSGFRSGRGIVVHAIDTSASPTLDGLIVRGANTGIDLFADASRTATSVAPLITNCVIEGNGIGLLASAYTFDGATAQVDPILTNDSFSGNSDGVVFETMAGYGLPTGARRNASSTAVVTHCTFADNVGSGIILDDTNGFDSAAGPCRPAVLNSIFSAVNGDYGIHEFSNTSFPSLLENNMFEASPLGFYRADGLTDLLTIGEVNALNSSDANFEGAPAFLRDTESNWRLRADSPGVDSAQRGALNLDFEGEARPTDTDGNGDAREEVGFDEAPNCAVSAVLVPDMPEDRCGVFGPLDFDASMSAMSPGFADCSEPLTFQWYVDGVPLPGETTPFLSVTPDATALYQVRVSCADDPACYDVASAPVTVFELPVADAGGTWSACIPDGEDTVSIELTGTATPAEGTAIESWSWSTANPNAAFLGGATENPILEVTGYTDFANLSFDVTLTVTDSNGCEVTDTAVVNVFRGPRPDAGGPYVACSDPGSQSFVPLDGSAMTPVGSNIVAWQWDSSVGEFDDPTLQSPSLIRNNVPFTVTSVVTVTVTDDKGCVATSEDVLVTLHPSPTANAGGPYQLQEDMSGTTSFPIMGFASGGTGTLTYGWTTDLGTFVPPSADQLSLQLDIVNTGVDQIANVCLTATDENGCAREDCTIASVKASPLQPPNDVGDTYRIAKFNAEGFHLWTNSPLDFTHDLADRYEIWQSSNPVLPDMGGWTVRVPDIVPRGGISLHQEAALLDLAEPDLLWLKVVARNDAGASCVTPPAPRVTLDPDCAP